MSSRGRSPAELGPDVRAAFDHSPCVGKGVHNAQRPSVTATRFGAGRTLRPRIGDVDPNTVFLLLKRQTNRRPAVADRVGDELGYDATSIVTRA